MGTDYWDTFKEIAREILQTRMPAGWTLSQLDAKERRVSATFKWSRDHELTIETTGRNEHEALAEIGRALDGLARQR